jgi:hypothetical protein
MPKVVLNCASCLIPFERYKCQVKGTKNFCSNDCKVIGFSRSVTERKVKESIPCAFCKKPCYTAVFKTLRSYFCSKWCKTKGAEFKGIQSSPRKGFRYD